MDRDWKLGDITEIEAKLREMGLDHDQIKQVTFIMYEEMQELIRLCKLEKFCDSKWNKK